MNEEKQLMVPSGPKAGPPAPPPFAAHFTEPADGGDASQIAHYLWVLRRHFWKILVFVALAVGITIVMTSRIVPIYESTAVIDIDRQMPSNVVGNDGGRFINDSEAFLATQTRIIQSDTVLRPVARKFGLVSDDGTGRGSETPVQLGALRVSRPLGTYLLQISFRDRDPQRAADLANAVAESYRTQTYELRYKSSSDMTSYMEHQMEDLRAKMEASQAKLEDFGTKMGFIGFDDKKTTELSQRLGQLNQEYTAAQADRLAKEAAKTGAHSGSVEALEVAAKGDQLRQERAKIDEKKQKANVLRLTYGPNWLPLRQTTKEIDDDEKTFDSHLKSVVKRIDAEYTQSVEHEGLIKKQLDDNRAEFEKLSGLNFQYNALKQASDTDKALYDELVRKVKEAGINSSFVSNAIRIADYARPSPGPVYPNLRQNAIVAFFAAALLGIAAALLSDQLDHTIRDPAEIGRRLNTEILGSLPVVKTWRGRLPGSGTSGAPSTAMIASGDHAGAAHAYEEAVRRLRDSILLPSINNGNIRPRTILLTSATPREGKSTTAAHLAAVHSQQKRKTLIVDADLRRPSVHRHFWVESEPGLSNVVNDEMTWRDAIRTAQDFPFLSVLPAGPASRRAADGLGTTLEGVLREAKEEYDLIVLDAPPMLGFAESLQVASLVDGVVVVALAGQTNREAVASVIQNLRRLHAHVIGLALNEVRSDMSDRYYYYGYYGKYYSQYYKAS